MAIWASRTGCGGLRVTGSAGDLSGHRRGQAQPDRRPAARPDPDRGQRRTARRAADLLEALEERGPAPPPGTPGGDHEQRGQDPRRQHVRRQRRARRHRGIARPTRPGSSPSTPASSPRGCSPSNGERLNALSTDDLQYFETRFFLVPGTGTVYVDAKLSVIRQRVGRQRLPRGADDPEPRRRARRSRRSASRPAATSPTSSRSRTRSRRRASTTHASTTARLVLGYRARDLRARDRDLGRRRRRAIDEHGLTFTVTIGPHGSGAPTLDVATGAGRRQPGAHGAAHGPRRDPRQAHGRETSTSGSTAAPRLECDWDAAEGHLPAQPGRSRRPALLAARRCRATRLPAAGLPWFMTMFGRDSILTSLQALPFTPELAATTLRALGELAGHAARRLPRRGPGPHPPRDALRRADRLRGAPALAVLRLRRRHPALRRAARRVRALDGRHASSCASSSSRRGPRCDWIDEYADLQGNGYVSYKRRNEKTGLENQCWKDSWDSISYRDGDLPGFPRATCELQGYAYDAKVRGARLARARLARPGVRRPAREGGGRPEAPVQPGLLGRGRRVLRRRPRRRRTPGRRAHLEQRPPAVERHRRQVQGQGGRAATCWARGCSPAGACARWPRARAATTRSATTSARSGRSTTRSSPGACAATDSRRRRRRSPPGILAAAEFFDGRLPEAFGGYRART